MVGGAFVVFYIDQLFIVHMVGVAQLVERAVVVRVVVGSSPTVHPKSAVILLFVIHANQNSFAAIYPPSCPHSEDGIRPGSFV